MSNSYRERSRQENHACLEIEEKLRGHYEKLTLELGSPHNILGIFYHELMIYVTNVYLLQRSVDQPQGEPVFPFTNFRYAKAPFPLDFVRMRQHFNTPPELPSVTGLRAFQEGLRTTWRHELRPPFSLRLILRIGRAMLTTLRRLFDLGIVLLTRFSPSATKVGFLGTALRPSFSEAARMVRGHFPRLRFVSVHNLGAILLEPEREKEALRSSLRVFAEHLNFQGDTAKYFVDNFLCYCEQFLSLEKTSIGSDVLVTGSNMNLIARITSSAYQRAGSKVVSMAHGDAGLVTSDHAFLAYGDLSYCDVYLDYGRPMSFAAFGIRHFHPLQAMPRFAYASSPFVRRRFSGDSYVPFIPLEKSTRILYIPTHYSRNMKYGPYRNMDDALYAAWQRALLGQGYNITFKRHPVDLPFPDQFVEPDRVETRILQECLEDYDVYILDLFTTGISYAAATAKPILFFNLGAQNITAQTIDDLKKRVHYVDVEMDNPDLNQVVLAAFESYNQRGTGFKNEYSAKYCLAENPGRTAMDALAEILREFSGVRQ